MYLAETREAFKGVPLVQADTGFTVRTIWVFQNNPRKFFGFQFTHESKGKVDDR